MRGTADDVQFNNPLKICHNDASPYDAWEPKDQQEELNNQERDNRSCTSFSKYLFFHFILLVHLRIELRIKLNTYSCNFYSTRLNSEYEGIMLASKDKLQPHKILCLLV